MTATIDPEPLRLADGRRLQFWSGGAPDGRAVFFMHGCPDTRHAAFGGADAARREGARLVAVNRPGYGRSDPAESDHLSVADDTVAVADRLGIDRFAVLGMSVGGGYALACAARHPDRVAAAGVVASPADVTRLDPPGHRDDLGPIEQAFFTRLAERDAAEVAEWMRPEFEEYIGRMGPTRVDDDVLAERYIDELHPRDAFLIAALPAAEVAAAVREALAHSDGYLRDAAATFRAWAFRPEQVRCPTWLWYGDLDANASIRNGRWLAEHLPRATLVIRERTAHLGTLMNHWDDILATLSGAAGRDSIA
ncbi:MAG: alpha/beta fold hydrolase [Micromonosporaceae bacterium]